jgi:DivIVA domain-containing protein
VALDRQSIEKKDFPMGRRGYDPEAVDAHLSAVADEVAEVKRSAGDQTASLAASASEQVRAIVDAAETSAAQIRADAERESKKILADARRELRKARDEASGQATEHVAKVAQSAAAMLERIDAMEQEITRLVDTLRGGADRLGGDLKLLESNLQELGEAVAPGDDSDVEADAEAALSAAGQQELAQGATTRAAEASASTPAVSDSEPSPAVPAVEAATLVEAEEVTAVAGEDDEDLEGARLIALNMALNGNSREDIEGYLAENFDLVDRDALLDEVYASVEG